ncbi:MAG: hypothetical protein QG573_485 [Acidobacteriota bacterium]|nr:hypothetical protein [Acidobacteriota bacterium]
MTTLDEVRRKCTPAGRARPANEVSRQIRRLLLFAPFLLSFGLDRALALTCIGPQRLLFPPPGDIPPNPVFVFQLDEETGDPVRGLTADSFDISFIGGHSRVRVLERNDGVPGYITFTAVKPLPEGPLDLRLRQSFDGRPAEWTVLGTFKVHGPPDETSPTLHQQAHRATVRIQDLASWGTSITVDLPVTADEIRVFWLATIDTSEAGSPLGRPVTMFLSAGAPTLFAGPCGGNYPLAHGKQYLVDLTPIDAAGHRGQVTAPSILVEIP